MPGTRHREVLGALIAGDDPAALAEAKRREKEEAERRNLADTFGAVAEDYIKRHVDKLRSGPEVAGILRRELIPIWGDRQLAEIAKRDVFALLEGVVDRGGAKAEPGTRRRSGGDWAARKRLALIRGFFNWAAERDLITTAPTDRLRSSKLLGAAEPRDRVLTDDELRMVWHAAGEEPYPYGPLVRMLMLTAQRRDEIAGARWSEIDLDKGLLVIGAERMKMKVAHVVPLPPAAVEILRGLLRFAASDCVFAGQTAARSFSGFGTAKARFNKRLPGILAFSLHDLRRTARTRLSELGVAPFVAEMVLAHAQRGVAKVYDLHRYTEEKRQALEKWEARLLSIVELPNPEPGGKVVPLRRRARA
jgi:integrase